MKLDDFESVFRSSVKDRFHLEAPQVKSILLLTDLSQEEADELESTAKAFLASSLDIDALSWRTVRRGDFGPVSEMVQLAEAENPDLIVSYRHLLGHDKSLLHSLGSFIDTVTQATDYPTLLLPPIARPDFAERMAKIDTVLVATDHIIGDERLVNWGVFMCPNNGTVALAHVEDDNAYKRYMDIIAMIPDANTETTIKRMTDKLMGRPRDYIESIAEALVEAEIEETIVPIVTMGHALSDYQRLIDEHDVDLMVLNTKDQDQMAMHGMAYAIAIEIQDRPLLLL